MKRSQFAYLLTIIVLSVVLSSCGCGFTFMYNWRPKPWNHPFTSNVNTGLDSLIDINGYYLTSDAIDKDKGKFYSILFYNNGLCASMALGSKFYTYEEALDNFNSTYTNSSIKRCNEDPKCNYNISYFFRNKTSWGTYELHGDTIKANLIENLSGCDGTRKNIVSMTYTITKDRKLKQIFVSNSNKGYGYKKDLDVPYCTFYPLDNFISSDYCPYLNKKWFYKSDNKKQRD